MVNSGKISIAGCGWLGFPLAVQLREMGYDVHALTRDPERIPTFVNNGLIGYRYDGSAESIPNEFLADAMALIIALPPFHPETNDYPEFIQALAEKTSPNTRIFYTSSTGVYPQNEGTYDEFSPFDSTSGSKLCRASEAIIQASGRPHTILRLAGLFGPNRHPIFRISHRKRFTNGRSPLNLVHQQDVIDAIVSLLSKPESASVYNLVHPNHPLRKEYYEKAAIHYGLEQPLCADDLQIARIISGNFITSSLGFQYRFDPFGFP